MNNQARMNLDYSKQAVARMGLAKPAKNSDRHKLIRRAEIQEQRGITQVIKQLKPIRNLVVNRGGCECGRQVAKQPSNITILRATNGEVLPGNPASRVVLSSLHTEWHNLLIEEHQIPSFEWNDVKHIQHVVGVNLGRPVTTEVMRGGRFRRIYHKTGTISLFPSHQPISSRMKVETKGSAEGLFIAIDPVFFNQTAAALEIDPDRVELVEQRGVTDPTLRHLAMALRDGLKGGRAGDSMYGESLSTALVVHLLREYGGIQARHQFAHSGLSREQLRRVLEYIHDRLETALTVSGVARTVHMSPYHFARLFKQSTGQSPYRYVVQARVKKAKELLISGRFRIVEITHRLGFADQSHFTRHFKRIFGITPKVLQSKPYVAQISSKDPQEYSREQLA